MSSMSVHYSSKNPCHGTPKWFFDILNREFDFQIDLAASRENTKCARFYDESTDSFTQPWVGVCWMNPPYGRQIGKWLQKAALAAASGATIVCLVPARTDTQWWQDVVHVHAAEVRLLRGRLVFEGNKDAAPFPSAVIVFKPKHQGIAQYSTLDVRGLRVVH